MTTKQEETRHNLRCECGRRPIICQYGVNAEGVVYVHIKTWRQRKVIVDVVIYNPDVEIRCKDCGRWFGFHYDQGSIAKPEVNIEPPDEAAEEAAETEPVADAQSRTIR